MDLSNRTWKGLPDMREAKYRFNPCLFHGYVYVCGAGSQLVETFYPQTDQFLPYKVRIPESHASLLCVDNNFLVVHFSNILYKFTAIRAGQLVQQSKVHHQVCSDRWSNTQPVLDYLSGNIFYYKDGVVCSVNSEFGDTNIAS